MKIGPRSSYSSSLKQRTSNNASRSGAFKDRDDFFPAQILNRSLSQNIVHSVNESTVEPSSAGRLQNAYNKESTQGYSSRLSLAEDFIIKSETNITENTIQDICHRFALNRDDVDQIISHHK